MAYSIAKGSSKINLFFIRAFILLATGPYCHCQRTFSEGGESEDEFLIAVENRNFNYDPNFANSNSRLQHKWFTQKLDHLNESDTRPWDQRYLEYGGYYKAGGPIFLHIDGEGSGLLSPIDLIKKGSMAQYAKEQGAYIMALEHRFYGLSQPTSDISNDNLKFLNIRQAIGDIASFISWLKTHRGFLSNKLVLFGTSYGGSLVKWFSQMYPNMTDIIVASSAPLELKYEMTDYLDHIGSLINETDQKCYQELSDGFACLEKAVSGRPCGDHSYGLGELKTLFNLCGNLRKIEDHDITGLFFTIFNTFNNIVVNDIPDPKLNLSLAGVCQNVISNPEDELQSPLVRLARVVREITRAGDVSCVEFRLEKVIKYIQSPSWKDLGSINGDRQLQWQKCNELGWVKGTSNPMMPFGSRISTSFHAEICKRVFGLAEKTTKENVKQANLAYGGKSIKSHCGIYVSGNADPWSRLGVTSEDQAGKCNRAIVIQGASHAKDKGNIQPDISTILSFPPDLRPAQQEIGKILDTWLKTGNCCEPKAYPSGRILSDRYFYPIPISIKSPTPSRPKQTFPSDLLPNRNSTVPSVKIPNNDISQDETRRVETRTVKRKEKLDGIDIHPGINFKELIDFIEKHEKEFLVSNISNSEGRRYRVKIHPKIVKNNESGSGTFSNMGIEIRMAQVVEDAPRNLKQKPWWLRTDPLFEPRKLTKPNPEPVEIDNGNDDSSEVMFMFRSKKKKSSRDEMHFSKEINKSESDHEFRARTHKNPRSRAEKNVKVKQVFTESDSREPVQTILFKSSEKSVDFSEFFEDDENEDKNRKSSRNKAFLNSGTRPDSPKRIRVKNAEMLPGRPKKIRRKPKTQKIDSPETKIGSHEVPLFLTPAKPNMTRIRDGDDKGTTTITNPSEKNKNAFDRNRQQFQPKLIVKKSKTVVRVRNTDVVKPTLKKQSNLINREGNDIKARTPKVVSTKLNTTRGEKDDNYIQTYVEIIPDTKTDSGLNDNVPSSDSKDSDEVITNESNEIEEDVDNESKQDQSGETNEVVNESIESDEDVDNESNEDDEDVDNETNQDDEDVVNESNEDDEDDEDAQKSNESDEVDLAIKSQSPLNGLIKIKKDAATKVDNSGQSDQQFRPNSKKRRQHNNSGTGTNTRSSIRNISSSASRPSKNGTETQRGPKFFIRVQEKEIPVDSLDWRSIEINPGGQIADLSVTKASDSLALTGHDAAWVSYGIPWYPTRSVTASAS